SLKLSVEQRVRLGQEFREHAQRKVTRPFLDFTNEFRRDGKSFLKIDDDDGVHGKKELGKARTGSRELTRTLGRCIEPGTCGMFRSDTRSPNFPPRVLSLPP